MIDLSNLPFAKIDQRIEELQRSCLRDAADIKNIGTALKPFLEMKYEIGGGSSLQPMLFGSFHRGTLDRYSDIDTCILVPGNLQILKPEVLVDPIFQWLTETCDGEVSRHENGFSIHFLESNVEIDLVPVIAPIVHGNPLKTVYIPKKGRWIKTQALYQNMYFREVEETFQPLTEFCTILRGLLRRHSINSDKSFPGFIIDLCVARTIELTPSIMGHTSIIEMLLALISSLRILLESEERKFVKKLGKSSLDKFLEPGQPDKLLTKIKKLSDIGYRALWFERQKILSEPFDGGTSEEFESLCESANMEWALFFQSEAAEA